MCHYLMKNRHINDCSRKNRICQRFLYSRQPPSIEEAKAVVSSTFGNDKESKDIISAIASNIDTARREHKMVSLAKTTTAAGPEAQIAPPVAVIPDATMKH